jgi:molybdate transport system substrate-binding protein
MPKMKGARMWLAGLVLLCTFTDSLSQAQERQTIIIFAAASLSDAFEEAADVFEAEHPGSNLVFNFAGSSDLAAQLAEGAPADVFASANDRQMNAAVNAGRIDGTPVTFARNRLVLIVPMDNPAGIATLDDLATPGVKLIVAAPDVPVRDYTDRLLERLAGDPAYGEDYRDAVLANIVSEEQNVRQVVVKIALGEGDVGIVYRSDVTPDIADQVIAIPIRDALNTFGSYPIAVTNDSAQPELARAFIAFLLSDAGQALLMQWNFDDATTGARPPCGA